MKRGLLLRAVLALALLAAALRASAAQPPGFLYGATFFYERMPRDSWAQALQQYKRLGINTIDLYVMWNWHEPREGEFDFTGRTNPRHDLRGLLALLHADGFKIVLRPGPVIRNEWRNGGYPAWLLERPEYRMPLRDVLQGRYPATATLQNAHSDDAAAQWLRNATHMRYAKTWLDAVFRIAAPYRRDIVAVALDDDQGAYIDNQTWPAPHLHRYLRALAAIVHRGPLGAAMPVFINTYQMKVTASAPVWAWGNWYQSDAYSIGEHDRAQLEFSTGLLQTQRANRPVMISEFQAGWLQGADEAAPRPADPTNTTLALHTMLQMGAHGIVNFPVQDTRNPAGWEAPWTNELYAWDAALSTHLTPQARWTPTAQFGALIGRYGNLLAQTHPADDAAVAYVTGAYDSSRITNAQIANVAAATIVAQQGCRIMRIVCAVVDLRYATLAQLRTYPALVVPRDGVPLPYIAAVRAKLAAYRRAGGRIVASARQAGITHAHAGGIPNAVLLADASGNFAFLDVVNYTRTPLRTQAARVYAGAFSASVPAMTIAPRDAALVPLGTAAALPAPASPQPLPQATRHTQFRDGVYRADVYRDGFPAVVFQTPKVRLILSPCAGARAFVFRDRATGENLFTSIGALRDAWTPRLPPSSRDYIAKYTHPIATGTFNRCYGVTLSPQTRSVRFTYTAPDAPQGGVTFRKNIALDGDDGFTVTLQSAFARPARERAQELSSFALAPGDRIVTVPDGVGFYRPSRRRVVVAAWPAADVQAHTLERTRGSALLTLTFAPSGARTTHFAVMEAGSRAQAQAELQRFANRRESPRGSGGTVDAAASKAAGHNP